MKTYNKYRKLINSGKMTEQEIISFRKAVNGCSKMDADLKYELARYFIHRAENKGIKLEQAQQVKGYLWLKNNCYKQNGSLRKNPVLAGTYERLVLDNFKRFTCSGLFQASDNAFCHWVPIYRMYSKSGHWFEYSCNMGQITVLNIGGPANRLISSHRWPSFSHERNMVPS